MIIHSGRKRDEHADEEEKHRRVDENIFFTHSLARRSCWMRLKMIFFTFLLSWVIRTTTQSSCWSFNQLDLDWIFSLSKSKSKRYQFNSKYQSFIVVIIINCFNETFWREFLSLKMFRVAHERLFLYVHRSVVEWKKRRKRQQKNWEIMNAE